MLNVCTFVFVSLLTGILHGAGLWQLPKQLYLPTEEKSAQAPNSHLKYVWYDPQSLSFLLQAPPLLLSSYSLEVGHVFSPLLFLDSLQDMPLFFSPLTLIIFAVLFKKALEGSLPTFQQKKKKKKKSLERCLTLIPHMVASLPSRVLIEPC